MAKSHRIVPPCSLWSSVTWRKSHQASGGFFCKPHVSFQEGLGLIRSGGQDRGFGRQFLVNVGFFAGKLSYNSSNGRRSILFSLSKARKLRCSQLEDHRNLERGIKPRAVQLQIRAHSIPFHHGALQTFYLGISRAGAPRGSGFSKSYLFVLNWYQRTCLWHLLS